MAQAALSGNINAVGLLELLRIPMTTKRTGTLIVVCHDADADEVEARFDYTDGTLVSGVLGELRGEPALRRVLAWKDGEFEFIPDLGGAGPTDEGLHAIALAELRGWYAARSAAARPSSAQPPVVATSPRSAPPRVAPPPAASPPRPAARVSTPPSPVTGSGTLDGRGNLRDVVGQLSAKDGAVVFGAIQVASVIGRDMGVGALLGVEVRGKGERWLGAALSDDGAIVIAAPPDTDLDEELGRR